MCNLVKLSQNIATSNETHGNFIKHMIFSWNTCNFHGMSEISMKWVQWEISQSASLIFLGCFFREHSLLLCLAVGLTGTHFALVVSSPKNHTDSEFRYCCLVSCKQMCVDSFFWKYVPFFSKFLIFQVAKRIAPDYQLYSSSQLKSFYTPDEIEKEFNVFSLGDEHALAHYKLVDSQTTKRICPLCLCEFVSSMIGNHVVNCGQYRKELFDRATTSPIKRGKSYFKTTNT